MIVSDVETKLHIGHDDDDDDDDQNWLWLSAGLQWLDQPCCWARPAAAGEAGERLARLVDHWYQLNSDQPHHHTVIITQIFSDSFILTVNISRTKEIHRRHHHHQSSGILYLSLHCYPVVWDLKITIYVKTMKSREWTKTFFLQCF